MLRLCILAGLVAAAHGDDRVVCDGERPQDYCNCHTDCRETGEDAKFCACPEAQACCECQDNEAWSKTDDPEKSCAWVAKFPGVPGDWKRCRAKGVIQGTLGKVSASYACPKACATACHDDPSWHVGDDTSKNCAWVSRTPEVRCGLASGAGDLWELSRRTPSSSYTARSPRTRQTAWSPS